MYIDTTNCLKKICKNIYKETSIIGLDTEFIRKKHYFPDLCLIQIGYYYNGEFKNYIIDVLSRNIKLDAFYNLLKNKKIKKIFHSFEQDYDALYYFFNKKLEIKNFEDTQLMAEFCGFKTNMSYAELVKNILNINFEKDKNITVSNWKKRPLIKKQLEYAKNDVLYLDKIFLNLQNQLLLYDNYQYYIDEKNHFLKTKMERNVIKNAWKKLRIKLDKKDLNGVELVKQICFWRETIAIESNVIRNLIIEDKEILKIVFDNNGYLLPFKNIKELINNNLYINIKRKYKKFILKIIKNFVKKEYNMNKKLFYCKDIVNSKKGEYDEIYKNIEKFSENKHISMLKIISKADLIAILMKFENKNNILYGWKNIILKKIIENNIFVRVG